MLFSRKDRAKNQNIGHAETVDIAPTILNLLDKKTTMYLMGRFYLYNEHNLFV